MILNNDAKITGSGILTLWGGIYGNHTLTVSGNLSASSIQVDSLVIGETAAAHSVPEPGVFGLLFGFAWCAAVFAGRLRRR